MTWFSQDSDFLFLLKTGVIAKYYWMLKVAKNIHILIHVINADFNSGGNINTLINWKLRKKYDFSF